MRPRSGRPKARVLPEPVLALPSTSRPASASSMVSCWIGKGSMMPCSERASTRSEWRPSPAKVAVMRKLLAFVVGTRSGRTSGRDGKRVSNEERPASCLTQWSGGGIRSPAQCTRDRSAESDLSAGAAPGRPDRHNSPMRVLVVEDEELLAAAVADGLTAEGFDVDVAHNGPDGLWRARE